MFKFAVTCLFASVVVLSSALPRPTAADVMERPPANPDPAARYLFYMHGGYVEKRGSDGTYRYNEILRAFSEKGFVVIGEARGQTSFGQYSKKVADEVRGLLDAGVPPANITVAGHSKGGMLSLITSTRLGRDDLKFGIMAACGLQGTRFWKSHKRFLKKQARRLQGKFLIAWAEDDDVAQGCDRAMQKGGVEYENKVLPAGRGHKLFYDPEPVWIDMLAEFAKGG